MCKYEDYIKIFKRLSYTYAMKCGQTDWDEFFRILIGILFLGVGVSTIGSSQGEAGSLIGGFVAVGLGLAVIFSKR